MLIRPGGPGGADRHGAQSDQAQYEQGGELRQVDVRRRRPLQPEAGLRKQLGQRVTNTSPQVHCEITRIISQCKKKIAFMYYILRKLT